MGTVIEFIFTLPLRILATMTYLVWFVVFGLLKHSNIMPCRYDDWYSDNTLKLKKVIKWE